MTRSPRGRALGVALLAAALATACGDYSGGGSGSGAQGTTIVGGGAGPSGLSQTEQVTAFASTVYPIVSANCRSCHAGSGPGTPHIAHPDPAVAWAAVVDNQKVSFSLPESSRLVRRLATDFHFCWTNCVADGATMLAAINAWDQILEAAGSDGGGGAGVDVAGLTSETLTLADGTEDLGGERFEQGLIAKWDFKEGSGPIAVDVSGVDPPMDLTLENVEWLPNYGIDIGNEGFAFAEASTSAKLYSHIAEPGGGSDAYTIEAWVVPGNVTQEGPSRILTYSRNGNNRNFLMGQTQYQYVFRNRSLNEQINNNGNPELVTYAADQDLQATLQHVVYTFDRINGRRIHVDGVFTDDNDELYDEDDEPIPPGARLWNWDDSYRFGIGDEFNSNNEDRHWIGQVRFAAIYDRVLSPDQIKQNFDAGVGKRVTLSFDLSDWTNQATVMDFSVQQLDAFSYIFCQPTVRGPGSNGLTVQNVRVQVNSTIPVQGQAFTNVDDTVIADGQVLSRQCSVVPVEFGPGTDTFTIAFENLGVFQDPVAVNNPPFVIDDTMLPDVPVLGVRDFARMNETMAELTGVDPAVDGFVKATYDDLRQQLPSAPDPRGFASSNQVGVSKLAFEYCDALVESQGLRDAFFGTAFDFNRNADVAFLDPAEVDLITTPLLDRMYNTNVADQPDRAIVEAELDQLVLDLTACNMSPCDQQRTLDVVKGLCTATLSSAGVMVH